MAIRKVKLTISYDGCDYHGWQAQPGQKTIQGVVGQAVNDLVRSNAKLFGASRTDAGVSALGQQAKIEIDSPIPTKNLAKAITGRLPSDIAITEAVEVSADFDITVDAKRKLYSYTIFTGRNRPVLQIRHCWHLPRKLDIDAMNKAAQMLVGKKDFKSFASAADKRENTIRTIFRCDVTEKEGWIYIDTEGNSFLYNMVRNITGTLVEVGAGRLKPEKMAEIIKAKNRTAAGPIAPANGLCLMWIEY